ncbi:MAG: PorV/PorQ family protein [Ignavibacteriae bacterium]|nr:PorV/PorQ family protein [Ignavibacteriota bacterium]
MNKIVQIGVLIIIVLSLCNAQLAGEAGSFARMGFGARGIGMGNALTAISAGDINTYYNPALASLAEHRTTAATFSILSFDRYLNFLSYTQSLKPRAGISAGLINAGVRTIDGRDSDGEHTEDYSTFENQFFLSFANRVEDPVSIGVTIKLYYSKLFDEVTSTTVGFDVGGYVQLTDQLSVGAAVQDLNSKYRWDTKSIYGENGKSTDNKFPNLRRVGLAYQLPGNSGVISVEFENSSAGTNVVRFGTEYNLHQNFMVRGGVDRWDFSDDATGAKPSFGFTIKNSFNSIIPALDYAFVVEPFSSHGMHIITLSTAF